jgi:nanoRNase/pAp phosphatase (c-di-AMP/oligoRNAs hydrolase)
MNENNFSQIKKLFEEGHEILLTSNPNPTPDAISAALALSYFLKKIGKNTTIVIDKFLSPPSLSFLPEINSIKNTLKNLKKMILSVNLSQTKMSDLTYEIKDDKLHIFLTPQEGWWKDYDILTKSTAYYYDLTVIINTASLESIGTLFEKNVDFFYKIPIINIDNNLNNGQFGQVNLVDITALSICEIIYEFFKTYDIKIDETLATYLLTGILTSTNCFKSSKINPQILQIAGELIKLGAKREEIIANLYRKHTIKSLQLWGRALSRLKFDAQSGITWTTLSKEDFLTTGSDETYLPEVIDELIFNAPEAKIAVLIYEQIQGGVCCVVKTQKNISVSKLIKSYDNVSNEHTYKFCLREKNPVDAERAIIEEIKINLKEIITE